MATRQITARRTTKRGGNGKPRSKVASIQAQDHDSALHSMDDKFIDCRDLKHRWQRLGFFRQGLVVRRRLVCENCGCERIDRWRPTRSGVIRERPDYKYPEGYQVKGESFSLAEVREELLGRVTIFDTEEQLLESFANGNGKRRRMRSVS